MKIVATSNAPKAIGPYSQAIQVGELLFVSGQIPLDPMTQTIQALAIEAQTERVILNIKAIVEAAGATLGQVCKTTVFLKSMGDFAKFNEIYAKYFKEPYPVRSTVEVSELPKGALIEIESVVSLKS